MLETRGCSFCRDPLSATIATRNSIISSIRVRNKEISFLRSFLLENLIYDSSLIGNNTMEVQPNTSSINHLLCFMIRGRFLTVLLSEATIRGKLSFTPKRRQTILVFGGNFQHVSINFLVHDSTLDTRYKSHIKRTRSLPTTLHEPNLIRLILTLIHFHFEKVIAGESFPFSPSMALPENSRRFSHSK